MRRILMLVVFALLALGAQVEVAGSQSIPANSLPTYGFRIFPEQFKPVPGSTVQIKKIPPIRDQGSLGICYGFAAAAAFDVAYCKDTNIDDCSNLPETKMSSALAFAGLSSRAATGEGEGYGGSAAQALFQGLFRKSIIPTESCNPFGPYQSLSSQAWEHINKLYEKYQSNKRRCSAKMQDPGYPGTMCYEEVVAGLDLKNVIAEFGLHKGRSEMQSAFNSSSLSQFMATLVAPEHCGQQQGLIVDGGLWAPHQADASVINNFPSALQLIKSVLKTDNPVILDGVCLAEKKPAKANTCRESMHSILVTGMRTVCDNNGQCAKELKILNSWGEKWQNEAVRPGGWVAARALLDRTYYNPIAFNWINELN